MKYTIAGIREENIRGQYMRDGTISQRINFKETLFVSENRLV
jgi:hypothetical protein